jgi:hypothetical protein
MDTKVAISESLNLMGEILEEANPMIKKEWILILPFCNPVPLGCTSLTIQKEADP